MASLARLISASGDVLFETVADMYTWITLYCDDREITDLFHTFIYMKFLTHMQQRRT